jgi:hypothetical protein
MMLSMDEKPPSAADRGRGREWIGKLVVPVVVAVLGALLIGALTPVGDGLRELLFPTKAAVTGSAAIDGQPAPGAHLTLDGEDAGDADAAGAFLFVGVGKGTHLLQLEAVGAQTRNFEFVVEPETTRLDLGAIELKPLLQLGYVANVSPQLGPDPSAAVSYDLTLWIVGDTEVMNRIQSVSYTLPAPLPSEPVTGRSARKAFCYSQAGELPFQDLFALGGSFTTATATVDFGDGQPFQLSAPPGALRPPTCSGMQGAPPPTMAPPPPPPSPTTPPPPPPSPTTLPPPTTMVVIVPNVVCQGLEDARSELESLGLQVEVAEDKVPSSDCPDPGFVGQQNPEAEAVVEPGTVIVLNPGGG